MTEIFLDLLDNERKRVFSELKCLAKIGTLAGGTALSLQIRHRYSFDFDIFFKESIIRKAFKIITRRLKVKEKKIDLPDHLTFLTKEGIQITLFHYEFPPLYPKIKTVSLPLYNLKDIAADKAYTLGRRPAWRDYVDLFFLLKERYLALENLIKDAECKFKIEFARKLFSEQLIYYKDIRNFKVKFVDKKYSPEQIQEFFKKEVIRYTREQLF